MGQGQSRESSMGSMTDIQARAEQLGSNAGVRTGGSAMYFKSKDSLLR